MESLREKMSELCNFWHLCKSRRNNDFCQNTVKTPHHMVLAPCFLPCFLWFPLVSSPFQRTGMQIFSSRREKIVVSYGFILWISLGKPQLHVTSRCETEQVRDRTHGPRTASSCYQETRWNGSWRRSLKGWWEAPRWCHWQCLNSSRPMHTHDMCARCDNVCCQCCITLHQTMSTDESMNDKCCSWPKCLHLKIGHN